MLLIMIAYSIKRTINDEKNDLISLLILQVIRLSPTTLYENTFTPDSSTNGRSTMLEKEDFVNVPGGIIWYKIISSDKSKNKIPLLILHGGPGVPHNYLEDLKSIAKEMPVIFYDQLGCGHSNVINPDKNLWNLKRYITELEILIDHCKLVQVNLFGHSWGGALAIEYTLKHPDKIKSLILASPLLSSKLWIADARRLISKLSPNIQKTIFTHENQETTDSIEYKNAMDIFYQHFLVRMKNWPKKLKYSFDHINFDIYKTMWGASEFTVTGNLKDFDRINDMKKLNIPILLTGGRFDEATPETLEKAAKLLQKGKLIIYEKSAHFAFLEEETKYLKDLETFLNLK